MKKIKVIFFAVAALMLANCEGFLDLREGTIPSTGMDYTKAENIFLPISAAYAKLRSYGAHVFPHWAFEILFRQCRQG